MITNKTTKNSILRNTFICVLFFMLIFPTLSKNNKSKKNNLRKLQHIDSYPNIIKFTVKCTMADVQIYSIREEDKKKILVSESFFQSNYQDQLGDVNITSYKDGEYNLVEFDRFSFNHGVTVYCNHIGDTDYYLEFTNSLSSIRNMFHNTDAHRIEFIKFDCSNLADITEAFKSDNIQYINARALEVSVSNFSSFLQKVPNLIYGDFSSLTLKKGEEINYDLMLAISYEYKVRTSGNLLDEAKRTIEDNKVILDFSKVQFTEPETVDNYNPFYEKMGDDNYVFVMNQTLNLIIKAKNTDSHYKIFNMEIDGRNIITQCNGFLTEDSCLGDNDTECPSPYNFLYHDSICEIKPRDWEDLIHYKENGSTFYKYFQDDGVANYTHESVMYGKYLNLTDNTFYDCHEMCESCKIKGTDTKNLCLKCGGVGYYIMINAKEDGNCIPWKEGYHTSDDDLYLIPENSEDGKTNGAYLISIKFIFLILILFLY